MCQPYDPSTQFRHPRHGPDRVTEDDGPTERRFTHLRKGIRGRDRTRPRMGSKSKPCRLLVTLCGLVWW
eukprot:1195713-Prorocentrum_minimum.AAC.9